MVLQNYKFFVALFHCSLVGQSLGANLQDHCDALLAVFIVTKNIKQVRPYPLILGYQVLVM